MNARRGIRGLWDRKKGDICSLHLKRFPRGRMFWSSCFEKHEIFRRWVSRGEPLKVRGQPLVWVCSLLPGPLLWEQLLPHLPTQGQPLYSLPHSLKAPEMANQSQSVPVCFRQVLWSVTEVHTQVTQVTVRDAF